MSTKNKLSNVSAEVLGELLSTIKGAKVLTKEQSPALMKEMISAGKF